VVLLAVVQVVYLGTVMRMVVMVVLEVQLLGIMVALAALAEMPTIMKVGVGHPGFPVKTPNRFVEAEAEAVVQPHSIIMQYMEAEAEAVVLQQVMASLVTLVTLVRLGQLVP